MFPSHYFTTSYWARRFWGPVVDTIPTAVLPFWASVTRVFVAGRVSQYHLYGRITPTRTFDASITLSKY